MSGYSSTSHHRMGCITRLLIFGLFLGIGYWLLLGPISGRKAGQNGGSLVPGIPSKGAVIEGEISPTQRAALEKLAEQSGTGASVLADHGQVMYLNTLVTIKDPQIYTAEQKAKRFLEDNGNLLQIDNVAKNIVYKAQQVDNLGITYISYQQEYQGIPVFGSGLLITLDQNKNIDTLMAGYTPQLNIDLQPLIRSVKAEEIAMNDWGKPGIVVQNTTLTIFDQSIFVEQKQSSPRLAWQVILGEMIDAPEQLYLIDSSDGSIILSASSVRELLQREVYDSEGKHYLSMIFQKGKLLLDEKGDPSSASNEVKEAWASMKTIYDYYHTTFQRDSYDNKGGIIKVYINTSCKNFAGGWYGFTNRIILCNYYNDLDVIAHEFTHGIWGIGVKDFLPNIYSFGMMDAIIESYSDIMAAMIDTGDPWKITADNGKATVRDMTIPYTYGDFSYLKDSHENAKIHDYFAYLLVQGGKSKDNKIEVKGIGKEKAQQIFFQVLVYRHPSRFSIARNATIDACISLQGKYGISASDCEQVKNAFAAIGVGTASQKSDSSSTSSPADNVGILDKLRAWLRSQVDKIIGDIRQDIENRLQELVNQFQKAFLKMVNDFLKTMQRECFSIMPAIVLPTWLFIRFRNRSR